MKWCSLMKMIRSVTQLSFVFLFLLTNPTFARTHVTRLSSQIDSMVPIYSIREDITFFGINGVPQLVKKELPQSLIDRNAITWELANAAGISDLVASSISYRENTTDFLLEEFIPFFDSSISLGRENGSLALGLRNCLKSDVNYIFTRPLSLSDFHYKCLKLYETYLAFDLQRLSVFAYLTFQRDFHAMNVLIHYDGVTIKPIAIDFEASLSEKSQLDYYASSEREREFNLPFFMNQRFGELANSHAEINKMIDSWSEDQFLPIFKKYHLPQDDIASFQHRLLKLKHIFLEYPTATVQDILSILFYESQVHMLDRSRNEYLNLAQTMRNKYEQENY